MNVCFGDKKCTAERIKVNTLRKGHYILHEAQFLVLLEKPIISYYHFQLQVAVAAQDHSHCHINHTSIFYVTSLNSSAKETSSTKRGGDAFNFVTTHHIEIFRSVMKSMRTYKSNSSPLNIKAAKIIFNDKFHLGAHLLVQSQLS